MKDDEVFVIVDVQNDFCSDGALPVPGGEEVVPIINAMAGHFRHVLLTQDWHPRGHRSFASSHAGKKPLDTVMMPYGEQILWPDHCVQGSSGAAFHPDLETRRAEMIVRKGYHRDIDSYSAFFENDRTTPTGLAGYLRERGIARVVLAGLAFDFCVRYSAEDAHAHGFAVTVVEDACRGIDVAGSVAATRRRLTELGVRLVAAAAVG